MAKDLILSVLVMPAPGADPAAFRGAADAVIQIVQSEDRGGHPLPPEDPDFSVHPSYFRYEAAAARRFPGHYALTMARSISVHGGPGQASSSNRAGVV